MTKKELMVTAGLVAAVGVGATEAKADFSVAGFASVKSAYVKKNGEAKGYTQAQLDAALTILKGQEDKLSLAEYVGGKAFIDEVENSRMGQSSNMMIIATSEKATNTILDIQDTADLIDDMIRQDDPNFVPVGVMNAVIFFAPF